MDLTQDDDLNQENDRSAGFDIEDAYWSGVGLGFAYEEGQPEWRKRKKDSNDPSDVY